MSIKKYKLVGKALDSSELKAFPEGAKFTSKQTSQWRSLTTDQLSQGESFHHLDRLGTLMRTSVNLQCPVGPHDDPGLDVSVIRACSISKTGSVAIQCSQGHWAEYPCS